MILVDSSVLIDFLRGRETPGTATLWAALGTPGILIGNLVLCEVLLGVSNEREARDVEAWLRCFDIVPIVDDDLAVLAARNYRVLRSLGVTVGKTIDLLIATRCMHEDFALLHNDRDFTAIAAHLPLREMPHAG